MCETVSEVVFSTRTETSLACIHVAVLVEPPPKKKKKFKEKIKHNEDALRF